MVDCGYLTKENTMNIYVKKSKNKNGYKETLWINFTHKGERYRKPLKLENTPKNMKLAKNVIIPKLLHDINSGEFFKNSIPTVDCFIEKSFELQSSNRKKITINDYTSKYNKHLRTIFGEKKLNEVKGTDITLWQNKMIKKGYAIKTIKSVRGILSTMFEDAIKDEIIDKNPVRYASQLSTRNEKKKSSNEIQPFTLEEIKKLISTTSNEQMRNLYMLLFTTGLRGGEAIGLKWENVDFKKKTIEIVSQMGRGEEGSPKWGSFRTIPIIDSLLPHLENQYKLTGNKNSYVFLNRENTCFWDISKIRENYWKKDLEKAKIPYRKIHQTRHTFCSTLISSGEDVNYVSKIAGHSSTKMTLEVYSKYIPNKNEDFGKIFNNSFISN